MTPALAAAPSVTFWSGSHAPASDGILASNTGSEALAEPHYSALPICRFFAIPPAVFPRVLSDCCCSDVSA